MADIVDDGRDSYRSSRTNNHRRGRRTAQKPTAPSTTPWSTHLLLWLSHICVVAVFFVIGAHHGESIWASYGKHKGEECQLDGEALTRKAPLTEYYDDDGSLSHISRKRVPQHHPTIQIPPEVSGYIAGMARVSRIDFLQKFDNGFPLEASSDGNREVVIIYDHARSLPSRHDARRFVFYQDTVQALENCRQLRVVSIDPYFYSSNTKASGTSDDAGKRNSTACLALHGQFADSHPLVLKWRKQWPPTSKRKQPTNSNDPTLWQYALEPKLPLPPKPVVVSAAQDALLDYLSKGPQLSRQLSSIVKRIAKDHDNAVVVMVVTAGHLPLLLNYLCACRKAKVDTSGILVFAADTATYAKLRQMPSVTVFDMSPLFAGDGKTSMSLPDTAEYGTVDYARIMMAKVYAVHMVNQLGHDVLFQDVDVVPLRSDYMDYFVRVVAQKRYPKFDLYMQYDFASRLDQYAPWGGNTGFYFLRANVKTSYLMSRLVRSGDLILKTRSHQATMSLVLSDMVSQFNLRVKVLLGEAAKFPVGYHFHQDWKYMRNVALERYTPYLFHMNWNNDVDTKQRFLQQMAWWYLKNDECLEGKEGGQLMDCCVIDPVPVCHYSDKPSKLPECKSYPSIETNVSFW